jgi:hypothetical protein
MPIPSVFRRSREYGANLDKMSTGLNRNTSLAISHRTASAGRGSQPDKQKKPRCFKPGLSDVA